MLRPGIGGGPLSSMRFHTPGAPPVWDDSLINILFDMSRFLAIIDPSGIKKSKNLKMGSFAR
jgi:hypothetical protein